MGNRLTFFTHDVLRAYSKSETTSQRPIYVRPPMTLKLPLDKLVRVDRPLYRVFKTVLRLFRTYQNHYEMKLSVLPSIHDLCFLSKNRSMTLNQAKSSHMRGFTCLYFDNAASAGIGIFINQESKMASIFDSKLIMASKDGNNLPFNGAKLCLNEKTYSLLQPDKLKKLQQISET